MHSKLIKPLIVLSLFDGMSCGMIALKRLGIPVRLYFAAEIDKHAIYISRTKYPEIIHKGSVTELSGYDLPKVDLILAGSPCQGFSNSGKGLNFEDPRSALFFEFVRILKECQKCNPDVKWLLENVRMKKEWENTISEILGIQPININSALVSAQNRERLYWTNIATSKRGLFGETYCSIPQPKDKGILLKDILQPTEEVDEKHYIKAATLARLMKQEPAINPDKTYAVSTHNNTESGSYSRTHTLITEPIMDLLLEKRIIQLNPSTESGGIQPYQQNRVYSANGINPAVLANMSSGTHAVAVPEPVCVAMRGRYKETGETEQRFEANAIGKTNCLTTVEKDNLLFLPTASSHGNRIYDTEDKSITLCSRSGGLGAGTGLYVVQEQSRIAGWYENENVIAAYAGDAKRSTIQEHIYNKEGGKTQAVTVAHVAKMVSGDYRVRRLTPIEVCRLQTVPDDYFFQDKKQIVSDSQIYKMCGNGWTVDVIAHILSFEYSKP